MKTQRTSKRLLMGFVAIGLAAGLTACGGSDDDDDPAPLPPAPVASQYVAASLVADDAATPIQGSTAARVDARLVNPWGLAFDPSGFAWIANNGTSTATSYDGAGVAQTLFLTIPAAASGPAQPTGVAHNATPSFAITSAGGVTAPATLLFASESGAISAWSATVDPVSAVTVADQSAVGGTAALYKGLAIGTAGVANHLYATDFRNNRVDVYDSAFARVNVSGAFPFTNPALPAGYAPYGVHAMGGNIYVTYAKQDATATDPVLGAGLGQVDMFDSSGVFIKTLIPAGGALNAPWGMAMAPAGFGDFSGMLLVANYGDGKINAFDPATGEFKGVLSSEAGVALVIDGLRGISFGNGLGSQAATTLFYTAGPANQTHGIYGRVSMR